MSGKPQEAHNSGHGSRHHHVVGKTKCMVHNLLNLNLDKDKKTKSDLPGVAGEQGIASAPEISSPISSSASSVALSSAATSLSTADLNQTISSKDELTNIAMSVRDMAKNLSNLKVKIDIRSVLIVSKMYDHRLIPVTRDLALWLLTNQSNPGGPMTVWVQDALKEKDGFDYAKLVKKYPKEVMDRLKFWYPALCSASPNLFDIVLTLGGDGTVLYTGGLFQQIVPPVLCFSLGSLGFMTQFDFDRREDVINSVLKNGLKCSLRMRFECTIMRAKSVEGKDCMSLSEEIERAEETGQFLSHSLGESHTILNDVVVDRGPNPTITTTELYGDCQFLTSIQADGVVISTPTGSTAYSLSAGGSLVNPDLPAILVSPICPHTLSFRPLVVQDSLVIRVGVPYDARVSAWCSFDGKQRIELGRGDFLSVSVSPYPFPLVQDSTNNKAWFNSLSNTLHWNQRERQRAFT
uniref:ARAD1A03190p n=1 Tax=Blastobotrys adeninivorans TaxID=409370 RepID=A0A060T1W5_BLAAD